MIDIPLEHELIRDVGFLQWNGRFYVTYEVSQGDFELMKHSIEEGNHEDNI